MTPWLRFALLAPALVAAQWLRSEEGLAFQREASEVLRTTFDVWRVGRLPESRRGKNDKGPSRRIH